MVRVVFNKIAKIIPLIINVSSKFQNATGSRIKCLSLWRHSIYNLIGKFSAKTLCNERKQEG